MIHLPVKINTNQNEEVGILVRDSRDGVYQFVKKDDLKQKYSLRHGTGEILVNRYCVVRIYVFPKIMCYTSSIFSQLETAKSWANTKSLREIPIPNNWDGNYNKMYYGRMNYSVDLRDYCYSPPARRTSLEYHI